jgi:RNA polymerase sigma-70 factor (ECF subfamily)
MIALNDTNSPGALIRQARAGDAEALGRLLELYRNYLRLLAFTQASKGLRLRIDPSDLVQETFLEAFRDFAGFQGETEAELVAWLRRILARNLADQARRHQSLGRDWRRQRSLEALLERSGLGVHEALASALSSPSARLIRRERAVVLADLLARLPADYREVLVLSAGYARKPEVGGQRSEVRGQRSVSGRQEIRKPSGSASMAPSIIPTSRDRPVSSACS